jgi:subtilisin-like proprotein convertase family protein
MAMGYSVMEASSTTYAGLRYATRAAGAADFDAEATQIDGSGFVTDINRWGDYASMEVDPGDDCTFWFTSEYVATTGSFSWNTRISSFRLPNCTGSLGLSVSPPSRNVCASSGSTTYDVTLVDPFIATTDLSVTGCPAGAMCTFSPNPVVYPATESVLTVSGLAGVAQNSYTMTVTATDSVTPTTTMFTNIDLTLFSGSPVTPTLTSPANGATDVSGTPTFSWAAASGATTYDLEVATDAAFSNIVVSQAGLTGTSFGLNVSLASSTEHFWRVRASNACGTSSWSAVFSFTTSTTICFSPGLAIPDNSPAGIDDAQTVATSGTMTDLNLGLAISHTWVGDLIVTLTHDASATTVVVIDRPGVPVSTYGCSENDIDVVLDDEASDPVEDACASNPAIGGVLIPNNALSAFDGLDLSSGWTLNVSDLAGGDVGTLDSWCLIPATASPPDPPFFADGFESGNTSAWTTTTP